MKRALFIITVALLFSGCGPGMVYRHLDWVVPWYVSDYLDLSADQRGELEQRLARQLEWHCRTQLPRYAALLRRIGETLARPEPPVTAETLGSAVDDVLAYREDLVRRLGPQAATILSTVSARQVADLFKHLEQQNRKFEEKYVAGPREARIERRRKRMVDRLEKWIGQLVAPQDQAVIRWSSAVDGSGPEWLAYRRRVQDAFQRLLVHHRTDPDFQQTFTKLLLARHRLYTPAYEKMLIDNEQHTLALLSAVTVSLTPRQRDRVVDRIASLASEVEALSCPGAASADDST